MHYKDARGFNYLGSWGTSGLDLWQHHDRALMAREVGRGKELFPGWNMARWWLSHDAYLRDPRRFLADFEAGVHTFAANEIPVMPVLFNRWRDPRCDFGGVSLDHIVPGANLFGGPAADLFADDSDSRRPLTAAEAAFGSYLEAVVGGHAGDARIVAWDLCNEPLMGPYVDDAASPIRQAELRWLTWVHDACKRLDPGRDVTVGNYPRLAAVRLTEPISDVISFHPYWEWNRPFATKEQFEALLDSVAGLARAVGKELIASETAWGSEDDATRVEGMGYTLQQLVDHGIGFTVYALQHSLVADLHRAEYGPVGEAGSCHFVNPDGSLRQGHELFNDFGI